jgi:hypothetical protein
MVPTPMISLTDGYAGMPKSGMPRANTITSLFHEALLFMFDLLVRRDKPAICCECNGRFCRFIEVADRQSAKKELLLQSFPPFCRPYL